MKFSRKISVVLCLILTFLVMAGASILVIGAEPPTGLLKPQISGEWEFTYSPGTTHTIEVINYSGELMTFSGDLSAEAVGNYYAEYGLQDYESYGWSGEDGITTDNVMLTWRINKAPVQVPTFSGEYQFDYDSTPKAIAFSNYDADLMTMSGELSGIDAGSYSVTFTLNDADNYKWDSAEYGDAESITLTWTIGKIDQEFNDYELEIDMVYGESRENPFSLKVGHGAIGYSSNSDAVSVDGNGRLTAHNVTTNPVTITVTAAGDANYNATSAMYTVNVGKAPVKVPTVSGESVFAYTREEQGIEIINYNEDLMNISGDICGTEANDYKVSFSLKEPLNYEWESGEADPIDISWKINKALVAIPTFSGENEFDYDETIKTIEFNNYDEDLMTMSGKVSGEDAGNYSITFTLRDTDNYEWDSEEHKALDSITLNWVINTANQKFKAYDEVINMYYGEERNNKFTISKGTGLIGYYSYDESAVTVDEVGTLKALKVTEEPVKIKVTAIGDDNYKSTIVMYEVNVGKASVTVPTIFGESEFAYAREEQGIEIINYNEDLMNISGDIRGTDANDYKVSFSLKEPQNYEWESGEEALARYSITPIATLISRNANSNRVSAGSELNLLSLVDLIPSISGEAPVINVSGELPANVTLEDEILKTKSNSPVGMITFIASYEGLSENDDDVNEFLAADDLAFDVEIYRKVSSGGGGGGGSKKAEPTKEKVEDKQIILTIGSPEAIVFGKKVINDVAPLAVNNRTMLPARFVAESIGAKVDWLPEDRLVVITKGEIRIVIGIDMSTAYVNGEKVELDSPAFATNNRTYLPVRFICESLGAKVDWEQETNRVIITKVD